jgi:hypothetical protein
LRAWSDASASRTKGLRTHATHDALVLLADVRVVTLLAFKEIGDGVGKADVASGSAGALR